MSDEQKPAPAPPVSAIAAYAANLCPHKLNPRACLKCFHVKPAPQAPQKPLTPAQAKAVDVLADIRARAMREQKLPEVHIAQGEAPKAVIPGGTTPTANIPAPFSYSNERGRLNAQGIWEPPQRPSIIDRLPSHPNPGGVPPK
jgi:hypothetical protein